LEKNNILKLIHDIEKRIFNLNAADFGNISFCHIFKGKMSFMISFYHSRNEKIISYKNG
jgi:hypothetical protein